MVRFSDWRQSHHSEADASCENWQFDCTLRPGGAQYFVREDMWSLKISEKYLNQAGLMKGLANRANIVGLEEMVLTDRYGKPISDAAGKANLESPSQKLYSASSYGAM